ncbi:G-protein coupled receptor 26-like [Scleropages formosus]|uniref:G protein-coupled receptor 78 n=1 Tax=Scleropages formosus TaxID=113540 RepID=A0A8C9S433_SCLFO|nr:G-protein coupled receptor 26-like [Scleropages formosus]
MDPAESLLALVVAALALLALLSNALVLLCLTCSAEIRRQVPGVFTANLSVCNVLVAALSMPATLLGMVTERKPVGDRLCHALGFLDTFLSANAMLSVAALSLDRWVAVVFPLSYSSKMRHRDAVLMVACAWLHALAFSAVPPLLSWADYHHAYASCTLRLSAEGARAAFAAFTVAFHACTFALALLTLCFAYLKVLQVARFHCRRIDVITMQTLFLLVDIHPSVKQRCLVEQKKRKQRATKKISIFIGSFVLCFGPYVMTRLVELLPFVEVSRHWGIVTKCLTYSKAASDPFAYSLLRQQYKKVLVQLVNRLLKRDLYPSSGHSTSVDTENDSCLQRIN